jgi:hypothetical protein
LEVIRDGSEAEFGATSLEPNDSDRFYAVFAGTPFERHFQDMEDAVKYRADTLDSTPRLTEFPDAEAWGTDPVGTRYIVEDERGETFLERMEDGWALAVEDAAGNVHSRHVDDDGNEIDVIVSGYDGSIICETPVEE